MSESSTLFDLNSGTPVVPQAGDRFYLGRLDGEGEESYGTTLAQLTAAILAAQYPVGSIYISTLATNPADIMGFGTWEAFGQGRMIVGQKGDDSDFNVAEETGGAKTSSALIAHSHGVTDPGHNHTQNAHTHTQNAHNHNVTDPGHVHAISTGTTDGSVGRVDSASSSQAATFNSNSATTGLTVDNATATNQNATATNQSNTTGLTVNEAGSGESFSLMNPYIVAFMWKRTA